MKPLYAKELRLLQPAYLAALLLAVVPVWLLPRNPYDSPESGALVPFIFGVAMLALSSFGREFGLQTFALLLAQPLERRRLWRTKSGLLAGALVTVFLAWCLSCAACLGTVSRSFIGSNVWVFGAATVVVAFAGGLWTTLLLRQVAAAFWFTILLPGTIAMLMREAKSWQVLFVLGLYSAAGFWWARRQFLGAQETAWTGGVVVFPGWRRTAATPGARRYRPWAALCWKELQLHQVGLLGMAGLFVLHLGVVGMRRLNYRVSSDVLSTLLEVFGGIWLVVPLLAGSVSVAEERKLGTLAEHLSLPVSRRAQFALKLLFTLTIGGLLCALLICTAEGIGLAVGADGGMFNEKTTGTDLVGLVTAFVGLAFLGFYASTLARNLLQALAAGVVSVMAICILGVIAPRPEAIVGLPLWRGFLIYYLGAPALLTALLWLAWRNFRSESGSDQLWRWNAAVLGGVLAGAIGLTSAGYHRAWEFLTPTDPRPGVARIDGTRPVVLRGSDSGLTVILPDGRLWVDRIDYDAGRLLLSVGSDTGFRIGDRWTSLSGNRFVPGSNWVSALANSRETVAIRSDGTLWISQSPRRARDRDSELPHFEEAFPLTRFGADTNWLEVVQEHSYWAVVLLKQDGTLWRLGTNSFSEWKAWPGLRSFTPRRLLDESGWSRILAGTGCLYAWKNDGSVWAVSAPAPGQERRANAMGLVVSPAPFLSHAHWRALAWVGEHEVGLRQDGTLWTWPLERPGVQIRTGQPLSRRLSPVSPDSDWSAVAGDYGSLVARRSDGSLWRWTCGEWDYRFNPFQVPPNRLGARDDWVAVGSVWGGALSLGADGSLYYWADRDNSFHVGSSNQPLLAPSRKPVLIENLFTRQP